MSDYRRVDWYDLPKYYDAVFAPDTAREADFLEFLIREYQLPSPAAILEPACGSARLMEEMGRRGHAVTGFDANPNMIGFATRRLASMQNEIDLRVGRMEMFRYRRKFHLAHCLVSTFKYLLTERDAYTHLTCVADHLRAGGLYVLGLHLTEYESQRKTRERWVAPLADGRVVCNLQIWPADRRKRLERVRSRLRIETGSGTRATETMWSFRTYDAKQLERLIGRVASLDHVATYDFSYDPTCPIPLDGEQLDVVLVLRKRA